jgi:hypothetical protein
MKSINPLQIVFGNRGGWGIFIGLCILVAALVANSLDWSWTSSASDFYGLFIFVPQIVTAVVFGTTFAMVVGITAEFLLTIKLFKPLGFISARVLATQFCIPLPMCLGLLRPPQSLA